MSLLICSGPHSALLFREKSLQLSVYNKMRLFAGHQTRLPVAASGFLPVERCRSPHTPNPPQAVEARFKSYCHKPESSCSPWNALKSWGSSYLRPALPPSPRMAPVRTPGLKHGSWDPGFYFWMKKKLITFYPLSLSFLVDP